MKKKYLIIILILISILTVGVILFISKDNSTYAVKVSLIEEKSPDRRLTVYKDDKEESNYKEIHYLNDVLLCKSSNPTINFGDVEGISELKIILNNDKVVIAKLVKGE